MALQNTFVYHNFKQFAAGVVTFVVLNNQLDFIFAFLARCNYVTVGLWRQWYRDEINGCYRLV